MTSTEKALQAMRDATAKKTSKTFREEGREVTKADSRHAMLTNEGESPYHLAEIISAENKVLVEQNPENAREQMYNKYSARDLVNKVGTDGGLDDLAAKNNPEEGAIGRFGRMLGDIVTKVGIDTANNIRSQKYLRDSRKN